jgi:hypothetical protein
MTRWLDDKIQKAKSQSFAFGVLVGGAIVAFLISTCT